MRGPEETLLCEEGNKALLLAALLEAKGFRVRFCQAELPEAQPAQKFCPNCGACLQPGRTFVPSAEQKVKKYAGQAALSARPLSLSYVPM